MHDKANNSPWITVVGLALLVILGGFLRLHNLDRKSITHVEMYVPGIHLPHGISVPEERLTLFKVVTSTLNSDTHPPAYYALMWFWTKCFGTSAWSVRLPSALLGIACIPLVFWLGAITGQTTAGWIAAFLFAINGHQVFWSQIARMFTLACFLGLLATILLLLIARENHASRLLKFLYVVTLLLGLSTHVFFWLILAAHILWTLLNAPVHKPALPAATRLQFLTLILGSPLLAFSAYQTGNTLASLSSNALIYAREFLQFSFAFPLDGYSSGVYLDQSRIFLIDDPHISIVRWLFVLLSLFLFVVGMFLVGKFVKSDTTLLDDSVGPSSHAWWLAALLGTIVIGLFIAVARSFGSPRSASIVRDTELMIALPSLLAILGFVVQKSWPRITACLHIDFLTGDRALIWMLAVAPFVALSLISLFKPIFNARGMLLLSPYLVLVLAAGIAYFDRQHFVVVILLAVIGAAHFAGFREYSRMSAGRADYKAFVAVLSPRVETEDVVFLNPEFYSTPLMFYMNSGWDRIVGRNFDAVSHDKRNARIWALWFYNYEPELPKSMEEALSSYHPVQTVEAPGGQATLYVRDNF
ncbi:MAG: glycosyltransferase family 39 protein [Candidatus Korobacteraceae bacterium]